MAIPNVNQLTSQLRMLPDPALKQAAMMYKNDPYILPMIISEDTARKQMRMAAQSQAIGGEPPKVADQAVAAIGQQPPMPPQRGPQINMPPQNAGLPGLNSGMANMADGGIAGYPDEDEIVGMAEGGVARYNGQDESRVRQDVQFARDQEAFGILLSELKAAQAKAAQGDQRAQSDVAAIQGELRRHIKRNPSFAQMLTAALPMGSAQAAPAAPQAAVPTPAGQIPGVAPGTQAPPSIPEGFFSRLGTQLGMSEETKRNIANLNTALGGALGPAYIPSYLPKAQSGLASLGDRIYNTLNPQKGVMTAEQIASAQKMTDTLRTGEAVEAARRAGQMGGATLEETKGLMEMARQTRAADRAARAAQVPSAAEKLQAASLAREAQTAARIPQVARMGQMTAAATASGAATAIPEGAAATGTPRPMSDTERAKFMEANTQELASSLPKEDKKDIIDAAKAATPKAERKGLTNDDYLVMGLTMMANPGRGRGLQGLLEAVGTGGMAAVQSKLAREKTEREMAKEESEAKYREALGEQARRGPSEIALIERVAKENNIPFTQAMEMIYSSKREPQTEEALMKAWSSSAFLQMQYPNPQDYIKLMRASTGGASQTSAADQALVSKYLNPR